MAFIQWYLKLSLLLVLCSSGFAFLHSFPVKDEYGHCKIAVGNWESSESITDLGEEQNTLKDVLFFLHVPRTGGRSFFFCLLKRLYGAGEECPRSYDKLHLNPKNLNCSLLSTHDDYSIMSEFPKGKTSVVTMLRNPIDRVLSTYEFSIEVAARFLLHPNLSSVLRSDAHIRSKLRGASTLDVWPWKHLVPWMREDLFARREGRKHGKARYGRTGNPYEMSEFIMPLHEYINERITLDIVHNGVTFQVAGLTNNSFRKDANVVRTCVQKYPHLGNRVLDVAKKRLDGMLFVGFTEDHNGSALAFNNVFDEKLGRRTMNDSHDRALLDVIGSYKKCVSNLRKTQSSRRNISFKRIPLVNFSKDARLLIAEPLLQRIASLNSLDIELYTYARAMFSRPPPHTRVFSPRTESVRLPPFSSQEVAALAKHQVAYSHMMSAWMVFISLCVVGRNWRRILKHSNFM